MERTLIFIKPDGVGLNVTGRILSRFENKGLKLINIIKTYPSKKQFKKHYFEHKDKDFFEGLIKFSTSGPVILMILEGENAVEKVRKMVGATNPENAAMGTIRGMFGSGIPDNVIHASDSVESAKRELKLWYRFFNRKAGYVDQDT